MALIFSGRAVKIFSQIRAELPPDVDGWGLSLRGLMGMVVIGGLLITGRPRTTAAGQLALALAGGPMMGCCLPLLGFCYGLLMRVGKPAVPAYAAAVDPGASLRAPGASLNLQGQLLQCVCFVLAVLTCFVSALRPVLQPPTTG